MMKQMKMIVGTLLIGLIASNVMATEINAEVVKNCGYLSKTAGLLMQARQNGMSMDDMMTRSLQLESPTREFAQTFIQIYFSKPKFATPKYQEIAVEDAKNEVYLLCLGEYKKKQ